MDKKKFYLVSLGCFLCIFLLSPHLFSSSQDEPHRPNIILIVIDALRRDHLSCYGYHRQTSPTIDMLAREGVFFSNVVSQSSQSGPSMASLFTGLYPHHHGVQFYAFNQSFHPARPDSPPNLSDKFSTLAEYFQKQGYTTWGIMNNPWLKTEYGFAQGFEYYEFITTWEGNPVNRALDHALMQELKDKPFFAYLHYMDVHAPYYSPNTFQGLYTEFKGDHIFDTGYYDLLSPEDLAYSVALYDEEISHVDSLIQGILEQLTENGILENTVLVVTSDHGDEFFEHQGMGHGISLYNELINTFVILYNPAQLKAKKITQRARLIDLLPTLLDILGIEYPRQDIDGKSQLPLIQGSEGGEKEGKPVFSELGERKAILNGGWKYIYDDFLQTEELYDLELDPHEQRNVVDKKDKLRIELKSIINGLFEAGRRAGDESRRLSPETRALLESLGYIRSYPSEDPPGIEQLTRPVTDRVSFSEQNHNPLQLVYGWKGIEKEGREVFSWIGPRARVVLKRNSNRQDRLVLEGKVVLEDFSGRFQKISVFCDGEKLGGAYFWQEGFFTLMMEIPPGLGKDRPLEFLLICKDHFSSPENARGQYSRIFPLSNEIQDEASPKLSLLISSVYLR